MDLFKNSFSHETVKWEDGGVMAESASWPSGISASLGCVAALSKRQFESRSGSACDMQCGEILDFGTWCGW